MSSTEAKQPRCCRGPCAALILTTAILGEMVPGGVGRPRLDICSGGWQPGSTPRNMYSFGHAPSRGLLTPTGLFQELRRFRRAIAAFGSDLALWGVHLRCGMWIDCLRMESRTIWVFTVSSGVAFQSTSEGYADFRRLSQRGVCAIPAGRRGVVRRCLVFRNHRRAPGILGVCPAPDSRQSSSPAHAWLPFSHVRLWGRYCAQIGARTARCVTWHFMGCLYGWPWHSLTMARQSFPRCVEDCMRASRRGPAVSPPRRHLCSGRSACGD